MADDETMTWRETVDHLMKVTGKNRRQATAELLQIVRKGEIPVTGINRKTGEREVIPPDQFPVVN